jgi:signal transduction histidine kinase
MRVLIAEDSGILRRALRRAVEGLGHECVEAEDGEAAWHLFDQQGADVVISDWMMPGLEGPELCRRVRAVSGRPYTYFVILTVLEEKRHALAGMRAGADDYLTKPVDLDDLQLRLIAAERVTELHRRLAVSEAEARARSYAAGLNAAQERAREQVAELLHGRVQSRLLVAHHRLSRAEQCWEGEPARARALVGEARAIVDQTREQDVRRASHMLHPWLLREGLGIALRALARDHEGQLKVAIELDPSLLVDLGDLVVDRIRLAIYRVIEEAVGNVLKHAAATTATVRVAPDADGWLTVEVRDDGRGFDPSSVVRGLGLGAIAGRVVEHGGTWHIDSAPARGTTLAARFPPPWDNAPASQEGAG